MRSVLVDERLSWISYEQFGNDREPNIFFAIERFLQDMAAITICCEFGDASPKIV